MAAHQVQNKDISTPGSDHVKVGQTSQGTEEMAVVVVTGTETADPKQKGEAHGTDGDGFVVEATTDGPHEMGGNDRHEAHGKHGTLQSGGGQTKGHTTGRLTGGVDGRRIGPSALERIHEDTDEGGAGVLGEGAFVGQAADEEGGEGTKPGGHVTADVIEGHAIAGEVVLDVDGRELHSGVDGGSDGPAERIPRLVIEPLEKLLGAVQVEILCKGVDFGGGE